MNIYKNYKRLFREYASKYKLKLSFGLLAGFLAGGSIFGILIQLDNILTSLSKDFVKVEKKIVSSQDDVDLHRAIVKSKEFNSKKQDEKEKVRPDKSTSLSLSQPYVEKLTNKIPKLVYSILEKIGISRQSLEKDSNEILILVGMFFFFSFYVFKISMVFCNLFFMSWVGIKVVADVREQLFSHILDQSFRFYDKKDIGELISHVNNDTGAIQAGISNTIGILTRAPVEIFFSVGYICYVTITRDLYTLFFLMFVGIPCSLLGVVYLTKKMKRHIKNIFQRISSILSHMHEIFSCIRVVKAYHTEKKEKARFEKLNQDFFYSVIKAMKYRLAMSPLMELVGVVLICIFLLICYLYQAPLNIVFPICFAAHLAYKPLKQLSQIGAQLMELSIACDRIFNIFDTKYHLEEKKDALPITTFKGDIVFDKVNFSYDDKPVLKDMTFTIPRGKFIAFVGEAGSGKSTIVNLLARFYDTSCGIIKIDGNDIKDYKIEDLRNIVAFVDQVSFLFNDTIANNIAYGKKKVSQEEIINAAKKAAAHKFIMEKTEGYNFKIGEKGSRLSGGQRQRVAIARSLIKNSPILVLDEATSSLDSVTEKAVQEAIDNIMVDHTLIVITHRLTTIKKANIIFVLGDGKLLDSGTHDELINRSGSYQDMYKLQFKT